MNIALGAVLILLLLFPGILLRFAYLGGPYSRKNLQTSLVDELLLSLIPAIVLQTTGFWFVEYVIRQDIDLGLLYQLITGPSPAFPQPIDFQRIEAALIFFSLYHLALFAIAVFLGRGIRQLVTRYNWDIRYHSLRFNNEWYYLLSGRIVDFPDMPGDSDSIDLVLVDVLTETKEGSYLYCGVLQKYYLSPTQGLDRIYLSNVYRRLLKDDRTDQPADFAAKESDARYYTMPGDLFVIPFAQIRNLNVTYYTLTEIAEESQAKGESGKAENSAAQ
jgi:hypothetical protein